MNGGAYYCPDVVRDANPDASQVLARGDRWIDVGRATVSRAGQGAGAVDADYLGQGGGVYGGTVPASICFTSTPNFGVGV